MPKFNKRHQANLDLLPDGPVSVEEAVKILKSFKAPKFDQTVNAVVNLGIDPKQADQALRGSISMPKGIGRSSRVVAFCNTDLAAKAVEAGAIEAGGEELVDKIEQHDLDKALAAWRKKEKAEADKLAAAARRAPSEVHSSGPCSCLVASW